VAVFEELKRARAALTREARRPPFQVVSAEEDSAHEDE
jgi:hypothetical protein